MRIVQISVSSVFVEVGAWLVDVFISGIEFVFGESVSAVFGVGEETLSFVFGDPEGQSVVVEGSNVVD